MTLTQNPVIAYIQSAISELRKVTWPTRRETLTHGLLIIGICLAVAALFTVLDAGLNWGLEALLGLIS